MHDLIKHYSYRMPETDGKGKFSAIPLAYFFKHFWPNLSLPYRIFSCNGVSGDAILGLRDKTAQLLQFADGAYDTIRYMHPYGVATSTRPGDVALYYQHYMRQNPNLLALIHIFQVQTEEEAQGTLKLLPGILKLQRVVFIFTTPSLAHHFTSTSHVRMTVTYSKSRVVYSGGQLPAEYDKQTLPPNVTVKDTVMCVCGVGMHQQPYLLNHPLVDNIHNWNTVCRAIRGVMDATLFEHRIREHAAAIDPTEVIPYFRGIDVSKIKLDIKPLEINRKCKVATSDFTRAFLDLDEEVVKRFNPIEGRVVGLKSSVLSKASILSNGSDELLNIMGNYGYTVSISDEVRQHINALQTRYSKFQESLLSVTGVDKLAYYSPGKYQAEVTVINPFNSQVVWEQGKQYEIIPDWVTEETTLPTTPVLDDNGREVGQDNYSIRYAVALYRVTTEDKIVTVKEKEGDTYPVNAEWKPSLVEFLQAFPLPKVPAISEDTKRYNTLLEATRKAAPWLKKSQEGLVALNSSKPFGILATDMGGGKTYQGYALIKLKKQRFNLVIVPPLLVSQWLSIGKQLGFYVRPLMNHNDVTRLRERYKFLQGKTPAEKARYYHADQEVYITSYQFLSIGQESVYEPWKATLEITNIDLLDEDEQYYYEHDANYMMLSDELKRSSKPVVEVESTRASVRNGAKLFPVKQVNYNYRNHIKSCPKCGNTDLTTFSKSGVCQCGYRAHSYVGSMQQQYQVKSTGEIISGKDLIFGNYTPDDVIALEATHMYPEPRAIRYRLGRTSTKYDPAWVTTERLTDVEVKQHSHYQYPAYKRLNHIFGFKLIDEVQEVATIDTQRARAARSIPSEYRFVASGTLSRGYVSDIGSALSCVLPAYSPVYPFPNWTCPEFNKQFNTVKLHTRQLCGEGVKRSTSVVPEASNIGRLRKLLNPFMTTMGEDVIMAEWDLPPYKTVYKSVQLKDENFKNYQRKVYEVVTWYKTATHTERQRKAISVLWELRKICDGEEKLEELRKQVIEWVISGHKFIVTTHTKESYRQVCQLMNTLGINVLKVAENVSAAKRALYTEKLMTPEVKGLVSRNTLINLGLNTLVVADKLFIFSQEYAPSIIAQLKKRIYRPGQKSNEVEVVIPIVRLPKKEYGPSVDESILKLATLKTRAINEILDRERVIRWKAPEVLLADAMEKQGAARVLQDIVEVDTTERWDAQLDTLFDAPVYSKGDEDAWGQEIAVTYEATPIGETAEVLEFS